jgi:hypothetical protein
MRILLAFLLVGTASLSPAQRSQEFRSRYGEPDIERFTAAPDIGLTVEYCSDGLACQIVVERKQSLLHDKQAEKYMKPEVASRLIDEIVPPARRGHEVNSVVESMGCAEGRSQEYENVWVTHYSDVCIPLKAERESRATVVFKRQTCPISPYAQIHN